MVTAIKNQKYSLEEYFELERLSEEKLEFWDGTVWSMAGASPVHERIVLNAGAHLRELLRGRKCSVFGSNLRVKVPAFGPYRYPDLALYCGEGLYETIGGIDVLTNPQMIIEVLSPSTEAFDRGGKFSLYKSISTLREYLLVAVERPNIVQYTKDEADWILREANGLGAKLQVPSLKVEIVLSEIYLDVDFPEPKPNLILVE